MSTPMHEGVNPEKFQQMQKEYTKALPAKIHHLQELFQNIKKSPSEPTLAAFRNEVHKLAGNAGSYGYNNISNLCKKWDTKLQNILKNFSKNKINDSFYKDLNNFIQELNKESKHGPKQ